MVRAKLWAILGSGAAAVATGAQAQGPGEIIIDDTITVVGTNQARYRPVDTDALTGFQLDFLELPRVVDIIPEQLILDQKITSLEEALRNTPGVSFSDGFGGTNDDFFIRGFRRNVVYRNGFRRQTNFKTNLTNVEYIQVVRGPAAITYGQVEPGGLVDIVTKKPLPERRFAGEVRYGQYGERLGLLDWSQPLGDRFATRIVASSQTAESFRDFTEIERNTIAASATAEITDRTGFFVSYEYRDEERPLDRGTITVPTPDGREVINNLIDIPISRRFGDPFEIYETEFHFAEASLIHAFTDDWNFRLGGAYENSTASDLQARPRAVLVFDEDVQIRNGLFANGPRPSGVFDDPTDQVFLARRADGSRDRDTEVFYANGRLTGAFGTGPIAHQIAIGGDYRDYTESRFFITGPTTNGVGTPLFDIRRPFYADLEIDLDTEGLEPVTAAENVYGVFFNDYIELGDRIGVLAGVRYDNVDIDGDGPEESQDAVSPQIGLNVRAMTNVSIFASYAEGFLPNAAASNEAGETLLVDPENSRQYEVGGKAEFFNGRVQTTLSLFDIEKTNVIGGQIGPDGFPVLRDGQTSRGVELSVNGQPIEGANVIAGYGYVDAEINDDDLDGEFRPANVAEHTVNLAASYEIQTGRYRGIGLAGNLFYIGERFGDDENTFTLDGYTLVGLSGWYTVPAPGITPDGTIRIQVAAKNVFDEEYFPASGGDLRIAVGEPRTVIGSVAFDF